MAADLATPPSDCAFGIDRRFRDLGGYNIPRLEMASGALSRRHSAHDDNLWAGLQVPRTLASSALVSLLPRAEQIWKLRPTEALMHRVVAIAFFIGAFASAHAAEIPKYPVGINCARFAVFAAGGALERRESIAERCVQDQQEAYEHLKVDWIAVTDMDQARCLRMTGEASNYVSLERCIGGIAARRTGARAK